MDHKTWLWRKKSTDKTASDKADIPSKENEEVQKLLAEKEELDKYLKGLNDKLASTLSDSKAKDEQVKKQTKIAQEAVAGWEKAESEMISMKHYLEESMQQQLVYEERVVHLDGALKECMQQLRFVREEQEQRIHDAVMKASREFEHARIDLEEQLSDTTERLAKSAIENSHLNKSILAKENSIEDLKRQLARAEADHDALLIKLESGEKDNASLKYEVRVLEKELDIRNEEREYYRQTADASHKQQLESVKKIAMLESECQRLRLLVRKRLPGLAAVAKMKNEVEMLERDSLEMRRKKLNSVRAIGSSVENLPESIIRRIATLTEQLHSVEEANKTLQESLNRKTNELQFSRSMLSRTASKLLQLESQIEESSKGQVSLNQPRSNLTYHEFSLASISDLSSDDKVSCAESWASALILELESFRSGKQSELLSCRSVSNSDINLMDDFIEMEKLAVVSATEISQASLEEDNGTNGFSEAEPNETNFKVQGKEIIPVSDHMSDFPTSNQKTCFNGILEDKIPSWLQEVVKIILEQCCATHKKPDDILDDIRVVLEHRKNPDRSVVSPSGETNDAEISSIKSSKHQFQTDPSKSISRIIELIEGISMPAEDYDNSDSDIHSHKNQENTTGYMARVFQWKTSELSNVLQQFLHVCYDLLNGKADHERFTAEVTMALDWIMNHCFSLQDVSSMRDAVRKQFDWDETRSDNEAEIGMMNHFADVDKLHLPREELSCLPPPANSDCHAVQTEEMQCDEKEKSENVKDKEINSEAGKAGRMEPLMNQLQESEKTIASLRSELQTLKESNEMLEGQIQSDTFINVEFDVQSTEAELKEAHHKILALEVELDNKNHYCEELETKCIELQLQLESMIKDSSKDDNIQKDKNWEITAATEKLAECQETILNLGKQLKTLASPKHASLFDNAIATQRNAITSTAIVPHRDTKAKNRSSLLDRMLAEDDTKAMVHRVRERSYSYTSIPDFIQPLEKILVLNGPKDHDDSSSVNSMAIVRAKKSGGRSLWKKLLGRKQKAKKKTRFLFST